ncbi:hypothetical protein BgiMline_003200, partial [Biomphalaria glabrata]
NKESGDENVVQVLYRTKKVVMRMLFNSSSIQNKESGDENVVQLKFYTEQRKW